MNETRDRIAALSPEKLAEFARKLSEKRTAPRHLEIPPQPRDGRPFPLSFAQQRLWFLFQLDRGSAAYNIVNFLPLDDSRPDFEAMRRSLDEVVRRHEILRTTYAVRDGRPVQIVHPAESAPPTEMRVADLSRVPADRFEPEALALLEEDSARPFDLETGPLLRSLVIVSASRVYWGFAYHHIVSDWWSATIFYREVMAFYERFSGASRPELPEPRLQYADFAAWERERLDDAALAPHIAFWRERLGEVPPVLELPTDRPRPAKPGDRGGEVVGHLPAATMTALRAFLPGEGATVFMALLAALGALLHRYSGQDRVTVGSAISNRDHPDVQEILGFFVNTLVFALDLEGDPTWRGALRRVKASCLDTFARQELPFEKLVAAIAPQREAGRNPLFEVIFSLEKDFSISERVAEEKVSRHERTVAAKFDLAWALVEESEQTVVKLEYRHDLFDRATAERLLRHYRNLVDAALADPEARLSELPLMDEAERRQVLEEWNRTARDYPSEASVATLFEERAAADPGALALLYDHAEGGEAAVSYAELSAASGRLAAALLARGAGRCERVALLLGRSPALATAMLGVLKAGAAYVPLDAGAPAARLAELVAESGARWVLVQERTRMELPGAAEMIPIEPLLAAEGPTAPPVPVGGDDLAYVMYTSGSTGRPKGIAVPHRAIVRLVRETDYVRFAPGDRIAQISNTAFDALTFEVWGALLNGGAVVGIRRDVALDPQRFAAWLAERRITSLFLTAALFNLVAECAPAAFQGVRDLLVGGQAVDVRWARRVVEAGAPQRLVNGYGPTESTTFAVCGELTPLPAEDVPLPIGRPIANTTAYLLDRHLRPVPPGVLGELCLGGDGLAWGYVRRPELTAEAFVPNPFGPPGSRLYRTGDIVRHLADGRIVFLGRRDHQVKIRGFRIEPGEIEAALGSHPAVNAAVVLAPADENGERRLVAYIEPAVGTAPSREELRAHLAERLPEYMIPAAWVTVERFPLTPNGKVDRAALPDPDSAALATSGYEAPRNVTEAALAALWQRFLGVERAGVHDDFFTLGGHSLLATQVVSRVREELGLPMPLSDLFEAPTPALLAARLLERTGETGDTGVGRRRVTPPIPPVERGGPLPLSFAQQRLWFLHRLEPDSPSYNMPEAIALDALEVPVDAAVLERALSALVERHESLRTRFIADKGRPFQVIDPPAPFYLRHEDLRSLPEGEREAQAAEVFRAEARRPFDLATGPVFRAVLVTVDDTRQFLQINLHHIVSDGWSLRILAHELPALYAAFRRGEPSPLAPLPVQYADFAVWQRRWLSGPVLDVQMRYWQSRLGGDLPVLELPTDFPRPPLQGFAGAVETLELPAGLARPLAEIARGAGSGSTIYMALLAGFFAVLSRFSGQLDILVGTPIANRNRAEIEGVVGFFVNTLVLRADLSQRPSFRALIEQVREATLGAHDHQDLPFETLVDTLGVPRDLSSNPLFRVLFDYHTDLEAEMLPTGVPRLGEVEIENAICDLSLSVFQAGDRLLLGAQYSTALFRRESLVRLLRAYGRLLAAAVESPDRPMALLPLLDEEEARLQLLTWSSPRPVADNGEDAGLLLPVLLRRQAETAPDAPAVLAGGRAVSYAELMRQAGHFAGRLRARGVGRETPVCLCLERTPEMVSALLGVLEAGGAYVPLDPDDPAERLRFLVAESEARLMLVDAATAPRMASLGLPVETLAIEEVLTERAELVSNAEPILPGQLAYVIYTSGSTGRPKGVMISHRGLASFARAARRTFGLGPGDRVLQFATLSFDVTVEEIFPTLLAGATLVLEEDVQHQAGTGFSDLLRRAGVTGLEIPTHFWSEWVAELARRGERPSATLRYVAIGTERVAPERLDPWRSWGIPLVHVYGLTEVTVTSLTERYEEGPGEPLPETFLLPIGRPEPGTVAFLADREMQPLPAGIPGEIYLGGPGLARGYLRRPDLTAERFVPNPFGEAGSRLYRTGDLGRYLDDGRVVFIGRADNQLKIRGYRMEPGEIEAALRQVPGVREAVAVAMGNGSERRLVAYVVMEIGTEMPAVGAWRRELGARLPEHMLPAQFVELAALPVSSNGKVDVRRLPAPAALRPHLENEMVAPRGERERAIAAIWQEVLEVPEVGIYDNFFELGGNSMLVAYVHGRLREDLGLDVNLVDLFTAPTIAALAEIARIAPAGETTAPAAAPAPATDETVPPVDSAEIPEIPEILPLPVRPNDVAVIAMTGRFSGTRSLEEFWSNVRNGVDSVTRFTAEEMLAAGIDAETLARPDYVRVKGVLPGADLFDAGFFGLPPREAEVLDPQHRIFLETAWEALELAGYDSHQYDGRIGVYAGCSPYYYYRENLFGNPAIESVDPLKVEFGNFSDFLPLRTSFLLGLDGPSVNVQSACSTSLTAIGEAYFSLLAGQCDMALAGGVSVLVPQVSGYFFHEANIWSNDGRCRSFDAEASGLVVGEGVGIVVLKRLADALADGDTIHAVIRGASIRNEGSAKVGFAAPGVEGQARMIREAIERAEVDPATIRLVEAHGSATLLGDPAEVAGLTQAFRAFTPERGFCALGSVKSNIGHADIAAGVAGFLKAALSLRDRVIPPSLHFENPNPACELDSSPFYVPTALLPWEAKDGEPRRAAVSSIGVGGTNTHMVLEEAPPAPDPEPSARTRHLLPLSARTATALAAQTERLAAYLAAHPEFDVPDVAATLQRGRRAFDHRRFVVAESLEEAVEALRAADPRRVFSSQVPQEAPGIAFLFAGLGAQYPGMGEGLYRSEPVFRATVDACAKILTPWLGRDLRQVIFPAPERPGEPAGLLDQPAFAEPALFAISLAMAELWRSWGVVPRCLIGHGSGELVAACLAGVMSVEAALAMAAARGRLAQDGPPAAWLTVNLPPDELTPLLPEGAALAAVNGPFHCVVTGPPAAIDALQEVLEARTADFHRLPARVPARGVLPDPPAETLPELKAPAVPFISSLTGTWITAEQATDPGYWQAQQTGTVRFAQGLGEVLAEGKLCLLEVSPGRTLTALARHQVDRKNAPLLLTSLRAPREEQPDEAFLLGTLGKLWLAGVAVEWRRLYAGERRRRVALPTYPFERQRYWIDPPAHRDLGLPAAVAAPAEPVKALRKLPDASRWFYAPAWQRAPRPTRRIPEGAPQTWLLFVDRQGLGARLAAELEALGQTVYTVRPGAGLAEMEERRYVLHPQRAEEYAALLEELAERGATPHHVVHLWNVGPEADARLPRERFAAGLETGYLSLLRLVGALHARPAEDENASQRLTIVSSAMQDVLGDEELRPEKAALLGVCRVLSQEHPHLEARSVDVLLPAPGASGSQEEGVLARHLVAECLDGQAPELAVAYRNGYRFAQRYAPVPLGPELESKTAFRQGGAYLVTGGQGWLGFELGALLARKYCARLVLAGHSPLPPREEWDGILAAQRDGLDKTAWKIRQVQRLEELGAEVLLLTADAADRAQMAAAIAATEERFGRLDGVLHAAGITDESHYFPIRETTPENCRYHFAPKVEGLFVLEELLAGRQVDFCLVFSSIAAILGGLGFVNYTAANAVMDLHVERLNRASRTHWVSVNWDGWLIGELVEEAARAEAGSLLSLAMTMEEGLAAAERILARPDLGQVAVSTGDLDLRIDRWVRLTSLRAQADEPEGEARRAGAPKAARPTPTQAPAASGQGGHSRPNLSSTLEAPRNELEQQIAGVWQELLGVEPIGIHDNFFELGGDSLLAVHLSSKLMRRLGVEVSAGSLLAAQTVAEQAVTVVRRMAEEAGGDLETLLAGQPAAGETARPS